VIALGSEQFAEIRRTVEAMFRIAHSRAYERLVDAGADELERFSPGNFGVFMGYDFHLTSEGPKLIEVNTNAGGALLNGLHTAALCDPAKLSCLCEELLPVETIQQRIARTFASEVEAVDPGRRLSRIAIADEDPRQQFLYPEFELFVRLFQEQGIAADVCDTSDLALSPDGLELGGQRVDLVYLRDTDFVLAAPRSSAVRAAYLARQVVVTPSPREHHLLANKRRLRLFSSSTALEGVAASDEDVRLLTKVVPETQALHEMDLERAWRERGDWVFKPCASFGSRGVYRGDKISRRKFEEIARDPAFLAQRRVAPASLEVETSEGRRTMKFDVRAYAYRDEILLLGARVYEGQVTNLRSPGGGFSAICVARAPTENLPGYGTCPPAAT
jgi:hypothetical protein